MGCVNLIKGFDATCGDNFVNKYYQNAVLINKSEIQDKVVTSSDTKNRVSFNLEEGATGYLFQANEKVALITGRFSKNEKKGVPYYTHKVDIVVYGVDEDAKTLLKQLDQGEFVVALEFKDGTVEIFGFDHGMKTTNYEYSGQGSNGGAVISLESRSEEYDPPYEYVSLTGTAVGDFDNLFADIGNILVGDFNNDFSDDFYIN